MTEFHSPMSDLPSTVPGLMGRLIVGRATALVVDGQALVFGKSVSVLNQKGFLIGYIAWRPSPQVLFFVCLFSLFSLFFLLFLIVQPQEGNLNCMTIRRVAEPRACDYRKR